MDEGMLIQRMRKVKVFKRQWVAGQLTSSKIENGEGLFVKYSVDYEEFESGPGHFPVAIVEMPNGTVKSLPVDLIQFLPISIGSVDERDCAQEGIKEVCLIDFGLLEKQLHNKGEFGWVHVSSVLDVLKRTRKSLKKDR
jgi:hypothetical protein